MHSRLYRPRGRALQTDLVEVRCVRLRGSLRRSLACFYLGALQFAMSLSKAASIAYLRSKLQCYVLDAATVNQLKLGLLRCADIQNPESCGQLHPEEHFAHDLATTVNANLLMTSAVGMWRV